MRAHLTSWMVLVSVTGWVSACGSGSGICQNRERDPLATPQLDECHQGWKQARCANCHTLPVKDHFVELESACAGCHGGNGACLPQGEGPEHQRSDICLTCHETKHDFNDSDDCALCHFADVGVLDCS